MLLFDVIELFILKTLIFDRVRRYIQFPFMDIPPLEPPSDSNAFKDLKEVHSTLEAQRSSTSHGILRRPSFTPGISEKDKFPHLTGLKSGSAVLTTVETGEIEVISRLNPPSAKDIIEFARSDEASKCYFIFSIIF